MPKLLPHNSTDPMRRSARAVAPTTSTNSVSSNSSTRAEQRGTRANQKHKSTSPSSEEAPTRAATSEPPAPVISRRSKRKTHEDVEEEDITKVEDEDDVIFDEDEETTRCICGFQEYPGLPTEATSAGGHSRKGSHAPTIEADAQSDEAGGLFIQCDLCKVWQHGGCVGIMEQSAAPDNYYCEDEKCRPDLHQLFTSSTG
jgi:hypothetical protein